ncbi:MAG: hypothetical protein KDB07_11575 [Planctomycetes bacterium]|nr:hypothetical protein [Planctomycetota bacterium]
MFKLLARVFRRDETPNGFARLGYFSDQMQRTSERRNGERNADKPEAPQKISSDDLGEACFSGHSDGWPAPFSARLNAALGDDDFFDQDTGIAEFFPSTNSQRRAILGKSGKVARSASTQSPVKAKQSTATSDEEYATEFAPKPSIRVEAIVETNDTPLSARQPAIQPLAHLGQQKEMMDALLRLPKLLEEARQAPEATVDALRRVNTLANALKSQQVQQREATNDIRQLKHEFDGFLATVTSSINDLRTMHQAAIDECAAMAEDSRSALRSQRRHVMEIRRQQQDAYYRLEDEQNRRIRSHEARTNRTMKKVGLACVAMLVLMAACVGVFMRYTASIINSTSTTIQRQANAEEGRSKDKTTAAPIPEIVAGDTAHTPRG